MPTHIEKSDLFYWVICMTHLNAIFSPRNTLSDIPGKSILSGDPFAQLSWHIKLAIMVCLFSHQNLMNAGTIFIMFLVLSLAPSILLETLSWSYSECLHTEIQRLSWEWGAVSYTNSLRRVMPIEVVTFKARMQEKRCKGNIFSYIPNTVIYSEQQITVIEHPQAHFSSTNLFCPHFLPFFSY